MKRTFGSHNMMSVAATFALRRTAKDIGPASCERDEEFNADFPNFQVARDKQELLVVSIQWSILASTADVFLSRAWRRWSWEYMLHNAATADNKRHAGLDSVQTTLCGACDQEGPLTLRHRWTYLLKHVET